jgi:hypothetical protein
MCHTAYVVARCANPARKPNLKMNSTSVAFAVIEIEGCGERAEKSPGPERPLGRRHIRHLAEAQRQSREKCDPEEDGVSAVRIDHGSRQQ